jgi:hypothetical protein
MKALTLHLCLAGALGSFCGAARAAVIQESYGPVGVNFLTGAAESAAFAGFNSELGALSSVVITYSANAVLLEGNAISSRISVDDSSSTLLEEITFPSITGRAQQVETGNFTVPVATCSILGVPAMWI